MRATGGGEGEEQQAVSSGDMRGSQAARQNRQERSERDVAEDHRDGGNAPLLGCLAAGDVTAITKARQAGGNEQKHPLFLCYCLSKT